MAMGSIYSGEESGEVQELSRVVFSRREADHLLQQVLAAEILLKTEEAGEGNGGRRTRLSLVALDEVADVMRNRLSDSRTNRLDSVLVVDDEPEMMLATRIAIERSGFSVLAASDGLNALRLLRSTPVAAVVLDLVMPGLNGWDVLREIRKATELPVLLVTAFQLSEADRLRGFEAGADDFVCKPYAPSELAARIRAVLRRETQTGGGARVRDTSFDGRRIVVWAPDDHEIGEVILSRPVFHSLTVTRIGSPADVKGYLDRTCCDLVILVNPTAAAVDGLNERLAEVNETDAPTVLVIAHPELFSQIHGPITPTFAFMSNPYRAQDLWAVVETLVSS